MDARLRAALYPHYCQLMAWAWRMGGGNKTERQGHRRGGGAASWAIPNAPSGPWREGGGWRRTREQGCQRRGAVKPGGRGRSAGYTVRQWRARAWGTHLTRPHGAQRATAKGSGSSTTGRPSTTALSPRRGGLGRWG